MHLKQRFDAGTFVILAEMEPPKGADVSTMLSNANRVKGKVDAFVVPEMSNAVMRMSALGGAMILQASGMETVMQVCCRDRNRLALQADLLAANACGISNLMVIEGEATSYGDHPQAKAVNDIGAMELLQAIRGLQNARDMAGIELSGAPQFLVGGWVNAGIRGKALEAAIKTMEEKMLVGARFFILPPVFDLNAIDSFLVRARQLDVKLIPTVLLLKSLGMARYIERHLDHVFIPLGMIKRIQEAPDKVRECVRIAGEMIAELKSEGFAGVLLSTMGWERRLPEVIEGMGG